MSFVLHRYLIESMIQKTIIGFTLSVRNEHIFQTDVRVEILDCGIFLYGKSPSGRLFVVDAFVHSQSLCGPGVVIQNHVKAVGINCDGRGIIESLAK